MQRHARRGTLDIRGNLPALEAVLDQVRRVEPALIVIGGDVRRFMHTPYDLEAAAARIRATEYPGADAFAADHVLRPPTEAAMLAAFER